MPAQIEDTEPWYRQFWPWFLILLPATVVVGGLTMLFIAMHSADDLVVDNYFKEGLAINQTLDQDRVARQLSLESDITWDSVTGEILVTLTGNLDAPGFLANHGLRLLLLHPTDRHADRQLDLDRVAPGHYRASVDEPLHYRYYLRLLPIPEENWRLNGEINFDSQSQVQLSSQ